MATSHADRAEPRHGAVVHHVFANRSNVGDWASAKGIQKLLDGCRIVEHLCDEPFVDATLAALAKADPRDLVVVGGGGLLMDYFAPLWRGLRALPALRLCIWGVGVVDHKAGRSLPPLDVIRDVFRRALVCRVRDEHTRDVLSPFGLAEPVPCPSLVAVAPRPQAERGVLHAANLDLVGDAAYASMRREAMAFAERTKRPYRETDNRLAPADERTYAAALSLYERSDVVVSSRLHGCLLAIATGRRIVAVSGDRKVESTMQAAGLGDWVLDTDRLGDLPERLARVDEQPNATTFRDGAVRRNRVVAADVLVALGAA